MCHDECTSRRGFLEGVGLGAAGAALGGALLASAVQGAEPQAAQAQPFPRGAALRVKPALLVSTPGRGNKTSWRSYGGIQTLAEAQAEAQRLEKDMKGLAAKSDFPIEFLPLALVSNDPTAKEACATDCDAFLVFGASAMGRHIPGLFAAARPTILFVRHRTEPHYFWYEGAHIILLRNWTDGFAEPNLDVHDVAVDDYGEALWRLRALYGLKNARGTKMLAIGGLQHYSGVGGTHAPQHAKEVWNYSVESLPLEEFAKRLAKARADQRATDEAERLTKDMLAQPNVTLATDRKFVANSFLALGVVKEFLKETGAANFGFAGCMGSGIIGLLDTPPCLVLSLACDEGLTAYCHADLTHTFPGVLLRWIASRPAFVCNSHFPHDGVYTVAHCAAPRRMNGKDYEPTTITTHYESDYGAATKVQYTKGQTVTVIIPALNCTKWQGFRGRILDAPSRPACRSQMDITVEGDWRRLLETQVGFHVQVAYGDWLREVGYALGKLKKLGWESFSPEA